MHVALAGCRDAWCNRIMATTADTLPDDPGTLKAMLLAEAMTLQLLDDLLEPRGARPFGQQNEPVSSRLANRHTPVPSQ